MAIDKNLRIAGAVFGTLAVILGAFATHALENILSVDAIKTFETGVKYQMYHSLLLLLIPTFIFSEKVKKTLCILLVVGIVFFSGSIYGLATNDLSTLDFTKIALITPLGGLLLIFSWMTLVYQFVKLR